MLAIRLQRVGRKHQPSYRIVVAERRSKLASPPAEQVGFYDPSTKEKSANAERVKYWMGIGAKPTPTVHNMLVGMGVLSGPKIAIKMNKPVPLEAPAVQNSGGLPATGTTEGVVGEAVKMEPVEADANSTGEESKE